MTKHENSNCDGVEEKETTRQKVFCVFIVGLYQQNLSHLHLSDSHSI